MQENNNNDIPDNIIDISSERPLSGSEMRERDESRDSSLWELHSQTFLR